MRTKGSMVVCYTGIGRERVLELGTKVNRGCGVEERVEHVVCTVWFSDQRTVKDTPSTENKASLRHK